MLVRPVPVDAPRQQEGMAVIIEARHIPRVAIRRVLVTGSRDWSDRVAVERALIAVFNVMLLFSSRSGATLVHGSGHGADGIADAWARRMGWQVEAHSADWKLGRRAGPIRNLAMVKLGADLCLAFIKDNSRGASGCAAAAVAAGIPTWRSDIGWVPARLVEDSAVYAWHNGRLTAEREAR